jgi:hypothetical protein
MPEHEVPDFERCSVCGRTALRGERLWDYVTPAGETRGVCALCKAQAEAASWLPAELAAARLHGAEARPSRARALRERLARVAESARARPPEIAEGNGGEARPARRRRSISERQQPWRREPADGGTRREAARGRPTERRRLAAAPSGPEDAHRLARRAIDRFNASEARRTVAGLMRSLGEPHASIQLPGVGGEATVTVAWELSWYQWAVEPGDHGEVREVSKGREIDELSDDARRWNGRVAEDGSLRLVAA